MLMVRRLAATFNGITVAYLMTGVNSSLVMLVVFGVNLTKPQIAALTAFINFVLSFAIHLAHRLGEVNISGTSTAKAQEEVAAVTPSHGPA